LRKVSLTLHLNFFRCPILQCVRHFGQVTIHQRAVKMRNFSWTSRSYFFIRSLFAQNHTYIKDWFLLCFYL